MFDNWHHLETINLLVPTIFLSQVVVELQIFRIFDVFFNRLRLEPKNKQKQTQADQSENKAPFQATPQTTKETFFEAVFENLSY